MIAHMLFALMLALPAQTGTVQGTVLRDGTTEPIAGVKITVGGGAPMNPRQAQMVLSAAAAGASISSIDMETARDVVARQALGETTAAATPLTAVTDNDGHFIVQNVPAGKVSIRAQLTGYFGPGVNGDFPESVNTFVVVRADESSNMKIQLVPGATISGKVFNSNGKPYFNAIVAVLRAANLRGSRSIEGVDGKTVDDIGGYRIYPLPPGEYYVSVMTRAPGVRATAEPASQDAELTTLYPNATTLDSASKVVVAAGADVQGIDVHVRTGRTATITGRVTSTFPPAPPRTGRGGNIVPSTAVLALTSREIDAFRDLQGGVTAAADADGNFQIPGVAPGFYDLYARLPIDKGWGGQAPPERATAPAAFGRATVEVRGNDIDNVQIVVHQGMDVRGRVTVDGVPKAAKLLLSIIPTDTIDRVGDANTANVYGQVAIYHPAMASDGTFTIPMVPEGNYRFSVQVHEPGDAYIADIRMDGISVYDNGLPVGSREINPLAVEIRTNGGRVDATVLGGDQKPVAGKTIVLIPTLRRQNPVLYQVGQSDEQGHVSWKGVAPGPYKLFAWSDIQSGAWMNADFIAKYEEAGTIVTVSEGTRQTAEVRVIP